MKLNFTEFSYGYAFTENLIRRSSSGPANAPVFPNLVQEAKLGYDVKIDLPGLPLFFQFKLPEIMVRDTAKEIAHLRLPGLAVPFFRMALMRRNLSDQHANLILLENQFPGFVFYAAPAIADDEAFNGAYTRAEVHLQSVLFSPNNIGDLPDNEAHSVSYSGAAGDAWLCSDPTKINAKKFETVVDSVQNELQKRKDVSIEKTARDIRKRVWPLILPKLKEAEAELRKRIEARPVFEENVQLQKLSTELLILRELVRVGLGVDMLIAQPRQSSA